MLSGLNEMPDYCRICYAPKGACSCFDSSPVMTGFDWESPNLFFHTLIVGLNDDDYMTDLRYCHKVDQQDSRVDVNRQDSLSTIDITLKLVPKEYLQ